jgi:hypothetical protein
MQSLSLLATCRARHHATQEGMRGILATLEIDAGKPRCWPPRDRVERFNFDRELPPQVRLHQAIGRVRLAGAQPSPTLGSGRGAVLPIF